MSQENVEVVRNIYRAWERGEFSSAEWADPDIELVLPAGYGSGDAVRHGPRRWGKYGVSGSALGPSSGSRLASSLTLGDEVLVLVELGGRGTTSGASIEELSGGNLFSFRDGKVVRLAIFTDRAAALKAAGLSE